MRAIWCLTWHRDTALLRLLGDTPALRILLHQPLVQIDAVDRRGRAPLHIACSRGMLEAARLLLEAGATPNGIGNTPMHFAASGGHADVVRLLLPHVTPEHMPLGAACANGHLEVARLLLEEGRALPGAAMAGNLTPLHQACMHGHISVALLLLDAGVPHSPIEVHGGRTPLHMACDAGHADIAALLLRVGASPAQNNGAGDTPLHIAARKGYIQTAKFLLAGGANPSSTRPVVLNMRTPMHVACEGVCSPEQSVTIVCMLLKAGADVTLEDGDGMTPLHVASYAGLKWCTEVMIRAGACTNAVDHTGWTPLHDAPPEIVKLLLDAGASPRTANAQGMTPLHNACCASCRWMHGRIETVRLLLAAGADVNAATNRRNTSLHMAAYWRGSIGVVDALIEAGANPLAAALDGMTPLDIAIKTSDPRVIERIRSG
jgi:ankyrin repeat protein